MPKWNGKTKLDWVAFYKPPENLSRRWRRYFKKHGVRGLPRHIRYYLAYDLHTLSNRKKNKKGILPGPPRSGWWL